VARGITVLEPSLVEPFLLCAIPRTENQPQRSFASLRMTDFQESEARNDRAFSLQLAGAGIPGAVHRDHSVGGLPVVVRPGIDVLRNGGGSDANTVMIDAVVAEVRFGAGRPPQPVGARGRSA